MDNRTAPLQGPGTPGSPLTSTPAVGAAPEAGAAQPPPTTNMAVIKAGGRGSYSMGISPRTVARVDVDPSQGRAGVHIALTGRDGAPPSAEVAYVRIDVPGAASITIGPEVTS